MSTSTSSPIVMSELADLLWPYFNSFLINTIENTESFARSVQALDPATIARVLLINHAIWVALSVITKLRLIHFHSTTNSKDNMMASIPIFTGFLLMCVSGMGGSLTTALLTGSIPIFIGKDLHLLTFFLVWIAMAYAPGMFLYRIANFRPVKLVIVLLEGIFLSRVVCGAVDSAVHMFPGSHVTPILLGSLSGFGGSLLGGFFFRQLGSSIPHELSQPTWGSKMALLSSSFYYLAQHVFKKSAPPIEILDKKYNLSLESIVAATYIFVMVLNVVIFTTSGKSSSSDKSSDKSSKRKTIEASKNDPKLTELSKSLSAQQQQQQSNSPVSTAATTTTKDRGNEGVSKTQYSPASPPPNKRSRGPPQSNGSGKKSTK